MALGKKKPTSAKVGQTTLKDAPMGDAHCITLARLTATKPKPIGKSYRLDKAGQLVSATEVRVIEGTTETLRLDSVHDFAAVLQALRHDQVLTYGVPKDGDRLKVVTANDERANAEGYTSRAKERYAWPASGGVLLIDYDPEDGAKALTPEQLLAALVDVCPEIATCARVTWFSSSSFIYDGDQQLRDIRGQRVYLIVKDAADIERAGEVLFKRLWLAGYGHIKISYSAALLERTIADGSVWQTNRVDFAAGASCKAPLRQDRPAPGVQDGPWLDTRKVLKSLKPADRKAFDEAVAKAKEEAEPERAAQEEVYTAARADEIVKASKGKTTPKQARQTVKRALRSSTLRGDFPIHLADGSSVFVAELLASPDKYHDARCKDPMEPDYNGGHLTGVIKLLHGAPVISSLAHGQKKYNLVQQAQDIYHANGRTNEATYKVLDVLKAHPQTFSMGSEIVLIRDGSVIQLDLYSLTQHVADNVQFFTTKPKAGGEQETHLIDPPVKVMQQANAGINAGKLKELTAVVTAPVMRPDSSVLDVPGYDAKTGLYLDAVEVPAVPEKVDTAAAMAALHRVMAPFDEFPLASSVDRGVLLAAILSAVQRPVLPTCPAFGFDAPVYASGKTYLASCVGAVATGSRPVAMPHTADEDETRKRLMSALKAGQRVLLWDNVLGFLNSVAMASLLTAERYGDRVLGTSDNEKLPNRMLVMFTGNNLQPVGDLPRRVLVCRLDPGMEDPSQRQFKGNPLRHLERHRAALVRDALILMRGYQQSAAAAAGGAVAESTASFELWDKQIRQCVAWVAQQDASFTDPAQALKDATANDPEKEELGLALVELEAWALHNDLPGTFLVSELCKALAYDHDDLQMVDTFLHGKARMLSDGSYSPQSVGKVLGNKKGMIAGGIRLKKGDKTKKGRRMLVEKV